MSDHQIAQQIVTDWLVELPDEMEFSKGVIRLLVDAIASALSQARAEPPSENCHWNQDDWGGDGQWETSCGNAFEFTDSGSGPIGNGFKWCGYCGKPIAEYRTSDTRGDEDA